MEGDWAEKKWAVYEIRLKNEYIHLIEDFRREVRFLKFYGFFSYTCHPDNYGGQNGSIFIPLLDSFIDTSFRASSTTRSYNSQLNAVLDKYNVQNYDYFCWFPEDEDPFVCFIRITCAYSDVLNLYHDLLPLNHLFDIVTIDCSEMDFDGDNVHEGEVVTLVVSPNPIQDYVSISGIEPQRITLYDVVGRVVLAQTNYTNRIDVSHLPQVLYFLHIISDKGTVYTKKLIKQ